MKILISTSSFGQTSSKSLDLLRKHQFEVILNPYNRKMRPEEIKDLGKNVLAIIAGTEEYDKKLFDELPHLKLISRVGVGTDSLDLKEMSKRSIELRTSDSLLSVSVAELVLGLTLSIARRINASSEKLREGTWEKKLGQLIHNKKVGIVGLGKIGTEVMKKFKAFETKIFAYDLEEKEELVQEYDISYCSIEDIFSTCEIITIHLSKTSSTEGLIDQRLLSLMGKNTILINSSRGGIVNETDLYNHLKVSQDTFAALDVFEKEPYHGPLTELKNVVLTPHIGSYTQDTREELELEAVKNVINFFSNE